MAALELVIQDGEEDGLGGWRGKGAEEGEGAKKGGDITATNVLKSKYLLRIFINVSQTTSFLACIQRERDDDELWPTRATVGSDTRTESANYTSGRTSVDPFGEKLGGALRTTVRG